MRIAAFIRLGYGVKGVIAANAAAVATAYIFALPRLPNASGKRIVIPDAFREAMQAIVFFVGQVVINNCDIVVVKHFFPPNPAGLYAAVALVGRVVFAFSWAIVNTMFPIVASARKQELESRKVLGMSLLLVLGIGAILSLALWTAPGSIWLVLFGNQFAVTGKYGLPYLLSLYAATTCVYSLSVVMIAYEMSHKIANTSWVQLMFSVVLIASIYRFHRSLQQVILVQLVMMSMLLFIVAVPFLADWLRRKKTSSASSAIEELRCLRGATQHEVIGEFLRTDFQGPESIITGNPWPKSWTLPTTTTQLRMPPDSRCFTCGMVHCGENFQKTPSGLRLSWAQCILTAFAFFHERNGESWRVGIIRCRGSSSLSGREKPQSLRTWHFSIKLKICNKRTRT